MACGGNGDDPDTPNHSDAEEREEEPAPPLASTSEGVGAELEASTGRVSDTGHTLAEALSRTSSTKD